MLDRLSSLALRRPRVVVAAWIIVLVVGVGAVGTLFATLDADLDGPASFESEQVSRRLHDLDPSGGEVVEGTPVADATLEPVRAREGVASAVAFPSADGDATGVVVELAGGLGDGAHEDLVGAVEEDLRRLDAGAGGRVLVGGELLLDEEGAEMAEKDAQRAETIALPITLVVMTIVFGGVLAAGLPLAIALGGVAATGLGLAAVSTATDVSLYAVNVTIMLGLGLGIDYGLLMVSRFKDERRAGLAVDAAVRRTVASAGRTVLFS